MEILFTQDRNKTEHENMELNKIPNKRTCLNWSLYTGYFKLRMYSKYNINTVEFSYGTNSDRDNMFSESRGFVAVPVTRSNNFVSLH